MTIPTIDNLPAKFKPFLIGSPTCPVKIKDQLDAIFQNPLTPLKSDYIFDAGKWVLKLGRTGNIVTTFDTHLYRVRKAEKIRSFISKNGLGAHVAVPHKYLYWNTKESRFYVVAEKMNLSPAVAIPASTVVEAALLSVAKQGGQAQALARNYPKRSLSITQAKALAELSLLGYTDLTYNNLYFTNDGKVAIIDTEPVKRNLKKRMKSSWFAFLFGDKGALLTQQSIAGIAKLKVYVDDKTALQAVEKVERNHVLWRIAQLIAKITIAALVIYSAPAIATLTMAALATSLKVSIIAVAALKILCLASSLLSVCVVWHFSCKNPFGVGQIAQLEVQGVF